MTVPANKLFSGSQWSEVESLSARDARRLQDQRLREQLAYLAARSEFCRVKFAEHGVDPGAVESVEDLAGLPFTEKQELRDSLAAFPPLGSNALIGTPCFRAYLAGQAPAIVGRSARELGVRVLSVGGEPGGGLPAVRENLESLWGATSREMLGGTDIACTYWGECEAADGMHFLSPDLMVAELIDPETGERVEPAEGAYGMLIVRGINLFPSAAKELVLGLRPAATGEMRIRVDFEGHSTQQPLPLVVEYAADLPAGRRDELRRTVADRVRSALNVKTVVELVPEGTLKRPDHVKVALIERVNG
jgi:phenylacetate-coenzyme A ligase PaaK-like adenylate-forming protein